MDILSSDYVSVVIYYDPKHTSGSLYQFAGIELYDENGEQLKDDNLFGQSQDMIGVYFEENNVDELLEKLGLSSKGHEVRIESMDV